MQIQVNTGRSVEGQAELGRQVEALLTGALHRFSRQITRVEVHLSDVNSHKTGTHDKRCVLEARLAGLNPIAVSHRAATIELAVDGAAGKLVRSLESTIGRRRRR